MKDRMSRVRAWLRTQAAYLPPVGWAVLGLAVAMAVAVTVSTVTANSRTSQPSPAVAAFEARWEGVPASVDRSKAESAAMYGSGYLWADQCRTKLYAGGRIIDIDTTWLSESKGAAIEGTRLWSCGGDYAPKQEPVTPAPERPRPVPYDPATAAAAAKDGYPYMWLGYQDAKTWIVIEMPSGGTFLIPWEMVERPQDIPVAGLPVPNTPDTGHELRR